MKWLMRLLAITAMAVASNVHASGFFMHPSSWGLMTNDDDHNQKHYHYNTFTEDENHFCHKRPLLGVDVSACTEDVGYYFDADGYILRGCGYGQHCSAKTYFHAGIDYEVPNHVHDPDDYENGQMKEMSLRQGAGGLSLGYHGEIDDIKASNDGVVAYSEEEVEHEFGNTIILRHVCNPSTFNIQELCVQEGDEWVIYTQYSHMSKRVVSVGTTVSRGQKIGEIGGTGGWIHHLHFEFKTKSDPYAPNDPTKFGYTPGNPTEYGYRDPFLFLGNVYVDDASDGCQMNSDGGQTCIIGSTTHIIHSNYRCSNNQCWEPGGDKNCWDASAWYEISNGDITNIIQYRDRDMCAEVYNSGTTYVPSPVTVIDPGIPGGGGLNDMKIKNVTMSKGAHSTRESTLYQDPGEKFYAYAQLDNDGTATAYNFKIKFYIDGGEKNFNQDDDDYEDSIRIESYQPDAKIRYAKELTSPTEPGTYWVYACVTSLVNDEDEDNNCSDEDSCEEYGKLIVETPYEGPIDSPAPTGKMWSQLTTGEKAAIMQILFD